MRAAAQGLVDTVLLSEVDEAVLRSLVSSRDEKLLDDAEFFKISADLGFGCSRAEVPHVNFVSAVFVNRWFCSLQPSVIAQAEQFTGDALQDFVLVLPLFEIRKPFVQFSASRCDKKFNMQWLARKLTSSRRNSTFFSSRSSFVLRVRSLASEAFAQLAFDADDTT